MPTVITLVVILALLLYAHHIDTERRTLRARMHHAALTRRMAALDQELPEIEAQYGPDSTSARYLRATRYLTSLELRRLTPRLRAGRSAMGGTR